MATVEHMAENPVGIAFAFTGTQGFRVIDPSIHNDFAGSVAAIEQTVLLKELRAEPVFVLFAQGLALAKLCSQWVLRYDFKDQFSNRRKPLRCMFALVMCRMLATQLFDIAHQRIELMKKKWMGKQRPAVDLQR